jgi:hypothetical protein
MKELWQGVDAYDNHLKCRFNLRAVYLWSIHVCLSSEIVVLVCKLETVFPPGWFNAMQHLLVHLP